MGALFALSLVACGEKEGGTEQLGAGQQVRRDVIPVETLALKPQEFFDTFEVAGLIEADDRISLASETAGRVLQVEFERGDDVRKGSLLVRLDDDAIQARIRRLRAMIEREKTQLEAARKDLVREESLFTRGVGSEKAFDDAQMRVRVLADQVVEAGASLDEALVEARRFRIVAPTDARVAERFVAVGDYVSPGSPLADLVKIDVVRFTFSIGERDVPRVETGVEVSFSIDAYPGAAFTAPVTSIAPAGSAGTRTFAVTLALPNPADRLLLPGMAGRARVVRSRFENVYLIPEDAILRGEDAAYVYIVEKSRARPVEVEILSSSGPRAVVSADFGDDAECVILGQYALAPEAEVLVRRKHEIPPVVRFD
jgi:membrane fusion protein, multidrug efflux system